MTQLSDFIPLPWWDAEVAHSTNRVAWRAIDESVLEPEQTFRSLSFFPPEETKVVILGQDPYDRPGKASGLAFGYHPEWGGPLTSSMKNIADEVERSTGDELVDYSLESWARQGVLLLNTRLSVAANKPMSHAGLGWEPVVRRILEMVREQAPNAVYVGWGGEARKLLRSVVPREYRDELILEASHPCKYSATRGHKPFLGCGHFADPRLSGIQWSGTAASCGRSDVP